MVYAVSEVLVIPPPFVGAHRFDFFFCELCSVLDYELTMNVVKRIVEEGLEKETIKENITAALIDHERIGKFYKEQEKLKLQIAGKENELKNMIKKQVTSGKSLAEFNMEYDRMNAELYFLKEKLAKLETDEKEAYFDSLKEVRLQEYLQGEKIVNNEIVRRYVFKMISMGMKIVRIILNDGKITDEYFEKHYSSFLKVVPIDEGFEKNDKDFI